MLKKLLLVSISLLGLDSSSAIATSAESKPAAPVCPPCPSMGAGMGWVLIPAGPGSLCNQGAGQTDHSKAASSHNRPKKNVPSTQGEDSQSLEGETINNELKKIKPQMFMRHDPYGSSPESKSQEWGKVWNQKVYFKENGKWVYDPTVNHEKDLVQSNTRNNRKTLEGILGKDQSRSASSTKNATSKKLKQGKKASTAATGGEVSPGSTGGGTSKSITQQTGASSGSATEAEISKGASAGGSSTESEGSEITATTSQNSQQANAVSATTAEETVSEDAIKKGKRMLHKNKEGIQEWTRFLSIGNKNQWYILKNNKWELFDEQLKGQGRKASPGRAASPASSDVRPSLTQRNIQTGPGTYNPRVPGAPGTPEADLNPVNRAPAE